MTFFSLILDGLSEIGRDLISNIVCAVLLWVYIRIKERVSKAKRRLRRHNFQDPHETSR
jgi:hypothetical protein